MWRNKLYNMHGIDWGASAKYHYKENRI
jgi:hypothetical protein